jgi:hypothetical protein
VIPYVFGLSVAPFGDWSAGVGGLLLGYALGAVQPRDGALGRSNAGPPNGRFA